jgi:D-alanyl-lipoteichoic acid acyltransferase DltB (MBOAT superfamily)
MLLILVFTLSGLWHVASWGWVAWGLFVGVWVAGEIQVNRYREADRVARARAEREAAGPGSVAVETRAPTRTRAALHQIGASVYVVSVLGFSMVLFRSSSLSAALSYYREIFTFTWTPLDWDNVALFAYAILAVVAIDHREHALELTENRSDPPTVPRALLWGAMLVAVIVFSGGVVQPFVYFQF